MNFEILKSIFYTQITSLSKSICRFDAMPNYRSRSVPIKYSPANLKETLHKTQNHDRSKNSNIHRFSRSEEERNDTSVEDSVNRINNEKRLTERALGEDPSRNRPIIPRVGRYAGDLPSPSRADGDGALPEGASGLTANANTTVRVVRAILQRKIRSDIFHICVGRLASSVADIVDDHFASLYGNVPLAAARLSSFLDSCVNFSEDYALVRIFSRMIGILPGPIIDDHLQAFYLELRAFALKSKCTVIFGGDGVYMEGKSSDDDDCNVMITQQGMAECIRNVIANVEGRHFPQSFQTSILDHIFTTESDLQDLHTELGQNLIDLDNALEGCAIIFEEYENICANLCQDCLFGPGALPERIISVGSHQNLHDDLHLNRSSEAPDWKDRLLHSLSIIHELCNIFIQEDDGRTGMVPSDIFCTICRSSGHGASTWIFYLLQFVLSNR